MPFGDVTCFTASDVDMLVDFLDGVQHEFGSKPRRDGVVSFQASEICTQIEMMIAVFVVSREGRCQRETSRSFGLSKTNTIERVGAVLLV